MIYTGITLTIVFVRILFRRYFPIFGIPCISNPGNLNHHNGVMLDTRNYNDSSYDSVPGSIQIPYAYLARYYHEIPKEPIHLIVNNTLDRNLSIRFLREKGFEIKSYTLPQCTCLKNKQ
ncbi:sulfurtransferase (plasmid) [Bacillus sp. N447-1]|uniref:sulfurtransferase n=1 Tax=Bacillus sp. N447-1 TaxID=2789208 RepID=UPI001F60102E|nr:sulfurtransferase [Bacillus sp. N447-1]UNT71643.1 sulfurtransferase [Bacillus sp. N447-1]